MSNFNNLVNLYSPTTISIYNVVGSYFVDIYYNHLYSEAHKFKHNGKTSSVTEGYKLASFAFLQSVDADAKTSYKAEYYNTVIDGIHKHFELYTSYHNLTVSECISKIVHEFVPEDYFATLSNRVRANILRIVLINSLKEFTKFVIKDYITHIIDNHDDVDNVKALQYKLSEIYASEREKMFHKFLLSNTTGIKEEQIPKKVAEKIRLDLIKCQAENTQMKSRIEELTHALNTRESQLKTLIAKYRNTESEFKFISADYKELKSKYTEAKEKLANAEKSYVSDEEEYSNLVEPDNIQQQVIQQEVIQQPKKQVIQQTVQPQPVQLQPQQPKKQVIQQPVQLQTVQPQTTQLQKIHEENTQNEEFNMEKVAENYKQYMLNKSAIDDSENTDNKQNNLIADAHYLNNRFSLGDSPSIADLF